MMKYYYVVMAVLVVLTLVVIGVREQVAIGCATGCTGP